jgi:hypothetical protein
MKFDILSLFRKYVENIQVSLESDKNNGHLNEDRSTCLSYLAQFFFK